MRLSPVIENVVIAGRLLFGALFVYNGVNHFKNYAAVRAYGAYSRGRGRIHDK